jgi:hypothetical protein
MYVDLLTVLTSSSGAGRSEGGREEYRSIIIYAYDT